MTLVQVQDVFFDHLCKVTLHSSETAELWPECKFIAKHTNSSIPPSDSSLWVGYTITADIYKADTQYSILG